MLCGDAREIRFASPQRTSDVEEVPMLLPISKMAHISGWRILKSLGGGGVWGFVGFGEWDWKGGT